MPDIIDTLVVALGLDASKFTTGAKAAQEELKKTSGAAVKHAGEIEAAGAKAAEFFTKLKNEALILAAVVTGGLGIAEFVGNTTRANIATGNLAKNLGISTEQLTAWERAGIRAGDSAEGVDSALSAVNSSMQTYKLNGRIEGPLAYFQALNVAALDSEGNLRSLESVMLDISKALSKRSPTQRAELARQMGIDGAINLLGAGSTAIQSQLNEMSQLGSITEADYEASKKLNAAWNDMKDSSEALGRSILTNLTGPLVETLKFVTALEKAVHDISQGKPADPEVKLQQRAAVRGTNSWLWDQVFGKPDEPGKRKYSGSVVGEAEYQSQKLAPTPGKPMSTAELVNTPTGQANQRYLESLRAKLAAARSPEDAKALRDAIFIVEQEQKNPPQSWGNGVPAAAPRTGIPIGARATAAVQGGGNVTTNETNIGQITINTKATDANGIARELPAAIGRNSLVNQADRGVR